MENKKYFITEEMAQKIIDTPSIEIKESGIVNSFNLSEEERLELVERILKNRRINK